MVIIQAKDHWDGGMYGYQVVDPRCADAACFMTYKNQSGIRTCLTNHQCGCPVTGVCEACRSAINRWGEHRCMDGLLKTMDDQKAAGPT